MYLVIIILPLLGSIASGFSGKETGINEVQLTCIVVLSTIMLAEIVLSNIFRYLLISSKPFKDNFGIIINKIYPSLAWCLQSPPKPHAFVTSSLESCPGKKPELKLDTKPVSTGNEGLDKEMEWRKKAGNCEHEKKFWYVADENDVKDPMLCDIAKDEKEGEKSTKEKVMYPEKHPAVKKVGDTAYLCDNCHMVICKDCCQLYPSSENTPISENLPESTGNVASENVSASENEPVSENEPASEYVSASGSVSASGNVSVSENLSKSDDKLTSVTGNSTSKLSLLDEFADVSTELPDYTSGDD